MVPPPIPAIIYNPCKDLFLFVKGERQDIKDLEERISELIIDLRLLRSQKEKIDANLRDSVFTTGSDAYTTAKAEVEVITKKYVKFINKYEKRTTNPLSSTTELNPSTEYMMILQLNDLKSKVMTKNFFKLAKLSRDIAKLSKRTSALVDILKPEYMTQKKSEPIEDKLGGGDDNVLPVFDTYVDKVLHLLEEADTVGITGRKGAGKTTVLKRLHGRLLDQKSQWEKIIWIDYPAEETETQESAKILMLQNEIVAHLNVDDFKEATKYINHNANIISTFLQNRKYILLMDHVSSSVDLEKLGLRENHDHGKVVICSTDNDVTIKITQRQLEIKGLNNVDAWQLFHNTYGELLHDSSKISIVDNMIDYYKGTAGMIHRIARHLKNKKDASWDYDRQILQSESKCHGLIDLGDYEKFYEMSYLGLGTEVRKCLLYGTLFPHRYEIHADYLIDCWIAEGLIAEGADQKVRRNRQLGQDILNRLTQVYLLDWYTNKKNVMMSSDFRRVAFQLGYTKDESCKFWVPSKDQTPDTDDWETVTRMSLIGCNVQLPATPKCPNISTLLLQCLKPNLEQLAAAFFFYMKTLQVLDLSHTEIRALPESTKKLVNLKSLYLKSCSHLVALPSGADQLVEIEFLDISGTSISGLPQQISCMVKMRCLRVSLSAKKGGNHIPPGVISNLRNLEELSIDTALDFQLGTAEAERLAIELAGLKHLNTLCFNFPNVSSLNTFVNQSKAFNNMETSWSTNTFQSFKIFIGCHETRHPEPDFSGIIAERWLRYSTNEEFSTPCQKLLKQASTFEIIGHDGIESFTCSKFDLHPVKVCVVERCKHLENIVNRDKINEENQGTLQESLLQNLEKLHLYDLESLKCIWNGPVPTTSLVKLTTITIDGCLNLTKILDSTLARSLQSLQYLKVENCDRISKIIEGPGESSNSEQGDLLESLRKIEMSNLPMLESICRSASISCKSLESITILSCSNLRDLSLAHKNAKNLIIRCGNIWRNKYQQPRLPVCHFEDVEESSQPRGQASNSGSSEITEHTMSSKTSISRGEASTNGSSEFLTEHNTSINSPLPLSDNLLKSQTGVNTDSYGLENDDIKPTDSHQPHDHDDHDRSACCCTHVKQSRGEKKSTIGCFHHWM